MVINLQVKTVGSFCFLNLTPNHHDFCNLLWIYLKTITSCKTTKPALPTKANCECKDGVRASGQSVGLNSPRPPSLGRNYLTLMCRLLQLQSKSSLEKESKSNEISIEVKRLFISVDLLCFA